MNEIEKAIETLYEIKQQFNLSVLDAECGDEDTLDAIYKNKQVVIVADSAIQILQAQAERDKMLCESCKHEPKNPTSSTLPCSMCSVAYASYFEPKENEL